MVKGSVSEKTAGHYRPCAGFSYAGRLFIFSSSNGEHGDTAQFVPSSFLDTHYSDAICLFERHRFKDH
jgi:hypothetical protein